MKAFNQNKSSFFDFHKTTACTIMLLPVLFCTGCDRLMVVEDYIFSPVIYAQLACDSQVLWAAQGKELWEVSVDGHVINSWLMENTIWGLAYDKTKRYLLQLDNETYTICQWYDDGTVNELFDVNIIGALQDIVVIDGTIGILDDFANVFYRFSMDGDLIDSFPLPMEYPTGIDYDGRYLWISDGLNHIYQMDLNGGLKARYFVKERGLVNSFGLACDGDYIWLYANMKDEECKILKLRKPIIARISSKAQSIMPPVSFITADDDF